MSQRPKAGALPPAPKAEGSAQRPFHHRRGARRSVRRRVLMLPLRLAARSQIAAGARLVRGQVRMQPGRGRSRLQHQRGCLRPARPGSAKAARLVGLLQLHWDGLHVELSLLRRPAEPPGLLPNRLPGDASSQRPLRKLRHGDHPRAGSLRVGVRRFLPRPYWRAPGRLGTPWGAPPEPAQELPSAVFGRSRGNT